MTTEILNRQFANLGLGYEIRAHVGGLFYIVSLRDGRETILNSAMSLSWVRDWAAERMRDFYRTFALAGRAYYPGTGAAPIFHGFA